MSITSPSADLAARARAWVAEDPEPRGREELERLLAEGPTDELAGRFSGELRFALPDCGARSGEPGGGAADGGAVHPRWSRTAAPPGDATPRRAGGRVARDDSGVSDLPRTRAELVAMIDQASNFPSSGRLLLCDRRQQRRD